MKKTYYIIQSSAGWYLSKPGAKSASKKREDAEQFASVSEALSHLVHASDGDNNIPWSPRLVKIEETPGTEIPGKEKREIMAHGSLKLGDKYVVHVGQSWIKEDAGWDSCGNWTTNLIRAKLYDSLDAAIAAWEKVKEKNYNGLSVSFERVKITKEPSTFEPVITETVLA